MSTFIQKLRSLATIRWAPISHEVRGALAEAATRLEVALAKVEELENEIAALQAEQTLTADELRRIEGINSADLITNLTPTPSPFIWAITND